MAAARASPAPTPAPPTTARVARLAAEQVNRDERFETAYGKNAVRNSEDLERILALPRRPVPDEAALERLRTETTARLSNGRPRGQGCKCAELNPAMGEDACITELRDIQAWYLSEAAEVQGALGPIAVGSGKTGIDILTAMVVPDCREAVLLIPPGLKAQFLADFRLWAQHFIVPNIAGGPGAGPRGEYVPGRPVLHVLKYSELSSAGFATWFKARPNVTVIIADEAQALKDRNATRVKRFLAHFLDQPDTRFFCHTGSLTSKGLEDYCVAPETRILTRGLDWVRADSLKAGDEVVGFEENLKVCKMRASTVTGSAIIEKPCYRVTTTKGSVVCSAAHLWVGAPDKKRRHWIRTDDLRPGMFLATYAGGPWAKDESRTGGYLSGLLDGEGWVSGGKVGFAQKPGLVLEEFKRIVRASGTTFAECLTHKTGVVRVLTNGECAGMRLLGIYKPLRLMAKSDSLWKDKQPYGRHTKKAEVLKIEFLGMRQVVALETTTRTFVAEGLMSHNSHLSALALREGSPVPVEPHVVTAWGEALNPPRHGLAAPPGALLRLCAPGETVHQGFARRFIETRGVVATFEGSLTGVKLTIRERKPPTMPAEVLKALQRVRTKMVRPDGEELQDALEVAATARQVACGFYMYWHFPGAKVEDFNTGGRIDQWFARRQAWNREVRAKLERHVPEMDSEGLLKTAARRFYSGYRGDKPMWASKAWPEWEAVERTVPHETRTKWISDWLARDAAAWVVETESAGRPGIIWTQNPEMGRRIAELSDRPYYGAGDDAALAIRAEKGDRSVVASIPAHHRGRNLQAFSANLIVQPPSDAGVFEQLLGRTHRSMQTRSEVVVDVYLHVAELRDAFDVAVRRARYVKDTTLSDQKLLSVGDVDSIGVDENVGPSRTLSITAQSSKS